MKVNIRFQNKSFADYEAFINALPDKELDSPFRSTIPSVLYWRDIASRLAGLCEMLGLEKPREATATFEHQVKPPKGGGTPSHTDLMFEWATHAIAVEAKYTEPHYETVKQWLKKGNVQNRKNVLDGWISRIEEETGAALDRRQLSELTYQMIHRTAAAVSCKTPESTVVYQVFDPAPEKMQCYRNELAKLATSLSAPSRLGFALLGVPMQPSAKYKVLQTQWNSGVRELHAAVREGIQSADFCAFGRVTFELCK
jgi:hypothetical protein